MMCIVLLLCVEIRAAGSQSDYGVLLLVVIIWLNLRPTPPHPYLFNYSGMDVMGEISLRHWLREGSSKLYQVHLFIIGSLNISD